MVLKRAHNPRVILTCFGRGSSSTQVVCCLTKCSDVVPGEHASPEETDATWNERRITYRPQAAGGVDSPFVRQDEFVVFGEHGWTVPIKQDCKRSR